MNMREKPAKVFPAYTLFLAMPRSASEKGGTRMGGVMEYSNEELLEARRQIESTLHKLRETVKTLRGKENPERYKSQITLAERRVRAFEIAVRLLERESAR